jgi:uncharacterized protein (DUF2249 family)
MGQVKLMQPGMVLKIINTFEPTPLIMLLEKKGFETYVINVSEQVVESYFLKTSKGAAPENPDKEIGEKNWESIIQNFGLNIQKIDVRHLEMPQPMHAILEALEALKEGYALYVYHKRIPVYLLPELQERGFDYRIKEIGDGEVHLLIFRN